MNFDYKKFLSLVTVLPGVYEMLNARGEVIYVGKAKNLNNRLSSYFQKNLAPKTAALVKQIDQIKTTITETETEALILENNLIKKHLPRYNILLRDDKSYPYIFLSNHKYPRLSFHRGAKKKSGQYFGPYPNANSVRESLRLLQKIFKVRQCEDSFFSHRTRACLQAQIGRCDAPCVGLIDSDEYLKDVKNTILFLNGKSQKITLDLQNNMQQASEVQNYELAARFRDQISYLRHIQEKQFINNLHGEFDIVAISQDQGHACVQVFVYRNGQSLGNQAYFFKNIKNNLSGRIENLLNVFMVQHYLNNYSPAEIISNIIPDDSENVQSALSFHHNKNIIIKTAARGEKVQLIKTALINANISLQSYLNTKTNIRTQLEDLGKICQLDSDPSYIECFDISHTGGEATVGSCVVFVNGEPSKSDYRRFNIKNITGGDDYAAMYQAITRRYTKLINNEAKLPDLLIVDGGKGQMTQAREVLSELQVNIPLLGVAKGPERQSGKETLLVESLEKPLNLLESSPAFLLIQKIRDEAHRFAITGHRNQRNKQRITSSLQEIPGVGAKRRQALLNYFGGLAEVKKAGVTDLSKVIGISPVTAQKIYDYFH